MLKHILQRFWSNTSGGVAMESVIIFPVLLWTWVGTFAFFDAYRVYNTSIKATFTVADLLARQDNMVYDSDLQGYADMLGAMIRDHDGVRMRATQIFMSTEGTFEVDWSEGTGGLFDYTTANIAEFEDRIPDMAVGERVILVESFIDYEPSWNVGLNDLTFENFTLTRPRYANQVPYTEGARPTS